MKLHTKKSIADDKGVTPRSVDNWVKRGLLPAPIKLGTSQQARVRWTDEHVAQLDRNLSGAAAS
jgi:hypothetical protein